MNSIGSLDELKKQAQREVEKSGDAKALEALRVKYLGRKGKLTKILRSLAAKPLKERKELGLIANSLKIELDNLIKNKLNIFKKDGLSYNKAGIDITQPGKRIKLGHLHLLTQVENKIKEIFLGLNFSVVEGFERETEYYNFDALNIPKDHPARDMWDTLWLKPKSKGLLMRTHTSPVQIHYMEKHNPPFQIIVPGRVFRHEATDFSHEFNFHQFEGLMVGENVSLANLKYIISEFFNKFFGKAIQVRFRPSYFPFTEPSVEVDIKIPGKGDWLEIAGAGMVHPNVFKAVKYNPKKIQGFAFGFGIERLAMIKYDIPDIRLFHSSDLRFIHQF